jgi:hypothetical protein
MDTTPNFWLGSEKKRTQIIVKAGRVYVHRFGTGNRRFNSVFNTGRIT